MDQYPSMDRASYGGSQPPRPHVGSKQKTRKRFTNWVSQRARAWRRSVPQIPPSPISPPLPYPSHRRIVVPWPRGRKGVGKGLERIGRRFLGVRASQNTGNPTRVQRGGHWYFLLEGVGIRSKKTQTNNPRSWGKVSDRAAPNPWPCFSHYRGTCG